MRNTFRLGPWLCETDFHRWCPGLYNLLLTEEHRWLVLFEMTVGNAEWLFSLQIKYPLYSAHSSARGYTVPLALRHRFSPAVPLSVPVSLYGSHAQNFTIFSVSRHAGLHTQSFACAGQKSSGSSSSVYHKCP